MKQTAKNRNLFKVGAVLLLAALWVVIPFALNGSKASAEEMISDTRTQASLTGAPINDVTPAGFSEHRLDDSGRRRLTVQASSVNLAAGTALEVYINNALVGQMSVDGFSNASLSLDTNNGQTVPVVNFGNPIEVRQNGAAILAGTFGTVTATPSPSVSPSGSPNGSPSPSVSPSGSPNGSPSPSVSPTASPTGSPSGSPSPTVSPSVSPSPAGSPNGGDLFAGLSGATVNGVLPNGFSQFEIHSSRIELETRIFQVNVANGTALTVTVNGVGVGQIFVSGGEGRLRLRSDNGQTVPQVTAGSTVAILNNGATILSGVFGGATGSPSPSPSVSPSASPSVSPTVSPSVSPTVSPSPTESPSPSPSPTASPSLGRFFESHPTGSQIDPPVTTNGTAEFKVTLSADETQATLTGEFHTLSSAQTGAQIIADIGSNSIIHDFGTIGGIDGNFPTVTIDVTPIQVQLLRAGLWVVTITSANNPNGELRGRFTQQSNRADFDGDGTNDLAVYRPNEGNWYSMNSQGFTATSFGAIGDVPVSADYDGDGKTDSALFKNVNGAGVWEIKRSSDGGISSSQFGFASDTPVRGDFDGDGRNDVAVFRPSTGTWYVQKSDNSGFIIVQFGTSEDIPVTTDMDGDGKQDITVFRPSTGVWYWIKSHDGGVGIVKFGQAGDKPVAGDFDGDGRDDVAVYRPSTGVWYIWRTSDGAFDIRQFGLSDDIPVAGNYDGDNKTDIAVFRPSTGIWYIWRSVDGTFDFRQFGLNGDIPVITR
ncbi:MAG TPA: FG-GAP-like repeat-containing protein [Pyrinomonadaceae bacterium]|jgi:hypothetical protein